MNKNKKPDTVGFEYDINHVAMMLREKIIRDSFDVWCEFEVFGVASAAWTQVAGCGNPNRNDVFYGTMDFTTSGTSAVETNNRLIPVANKFNISSKKVNQSDTLGFPVKTFTFNLAQKMYFTRVFLITSSHGAGNGGEEYNRRHHFIHVDDQLAYDYLPGFETCEPYRKYNTQGNGIYGSSIKTPQQWQTFSNWCPGAYVPTREIHLGVLEPGIHTIRVAIPDAQFLNNDDKIETSIFVQGKTEAYTSLETVEAKLFGFELYPNPANSTINIQSNGVVSSVEIVNPMGQLIWQGVAGQINIAALDSGMYFMRVAFTNGQTQVKTFIKN